MKLIQSRDEFKAGDKVLISRDDLIKLAEEAVININSTQKRNRTIAKSFSLCGLSPFEDDHNEFDKHIKSLTENQVYKNLIDANLALEL